MTGSERVPAGTAMERTLARRRSPWHEASGLLAALLAALVLWGVVLAGVVAPLGDALARFDARSPAPAPAACPVPRDAVASVAQPPLSRTCP